MDDYRTLLLKKTRPAKTPGGNSRKDERRARALARQAAAT